MLKKQIKDLFRSLFNLDKLEELQKQLKTATDDLIISEESRESLADKLDGLDICVNDLEAECDKLEFKCSKLRLTIKLLKNETELDDHFNANADKVGNIAYENKRFFKNKAISIYLNELIQRDSYEVLKFKKTISKSSNILTRVKSIGNKTSKLLTWTDDKHLIKTGDYYVQPNESIVYKKVDCEDHAFLNASLDEEIGVVYGFMTVGEKTFGHAWNCFIYNTDLYYLETTGNKANIYLAKTAKNYDGRFIVTRTSTYRIGKRVAFGKIADKI